MAGKQAKTHVRWDDHVVAQEEIEIFRCGLFVDTQPQELLQRGHTFFDVLYQESWRRGEKVRANKTGLHKWITQARHSTYPVGTGNLVFTIEVDIVRDDCPAIRPATQYGFV